jgi:hypothetical protein
MADTKISALADVVTLAAGDKVPIADASDLTVSKSATMTEVQTFIMKATSGVGTSPAASQTDAVTHSLGKTPTIIRIYGMSAFLANNSALPPVHSIGIWCSSGNSSIAQPYDATTITAAEPAVTSTAYAIRLDTGVGNFMTGVIQNVGATTFDIVWTETGTHTAQPYMWEAQ